MQALQSYLDRMGSNFLTAAMIPSLGFITLAMTIFQPIIPEPIINILGGKFNPLSSSGLVVLLFTIILGFSLTSLNTFVYKIFEGYVVLWRVPQLIKTQQKQATRLKRKKELIDRKIKKLKKDFETNEDQILKLQNKANEIDTEYQRSFPTQKGQFLPTRFGNVMKAVESYPGDRYYMDGVPLWTRLIHVIPDNYMNLLDQKNNQLSFLLNCSLLAILFAVLCLCASIYQFCLMQLVIFNEPSPIYFVTINLSQDVYRQRAFLYLACFAFSGGAAILFNRAALFIVAEYGDMVRASYDLFRFDLLAQLKRKIPKNLQEEMNTWENVSHFINIGMDTSIADKLTYSFEQPCAKTGNPAKTGVETDKSLEKQTMIPG